MIHKLPLGLAAVFGFAIYVAIAPSSCEKANRAVMPIHWAGKGAAFISDNISASNNQHEKSTLNNTFDHLAGYFRDIFLVTAQGKAYCTSFEESLQDQAPAYQAAPPPQVQPDFVVKLPSGPVPVFKRITN